MKYRKFGRTGWQVSEVGYGMWGMGGWKGSDDEESLNSLQRAIDLGCNFFDTAWGYGEGHSEKLFNRIADPVLIYDKSSHRYLGCNVAVEKVYGYSPDELKALTPFDLHAAQDHRNHGAGLGQHGLRLSPGAVGGIGVHDLVTQNRRQLRFGIQGSQQSAVDGDLAARQRPGIRRRVVQDLEFVGQLAIADPGQAIADRLHVAGQLGFDDIVTALRLPVRAIVLLPDRHLLGFGHQGNLVLAGHRVDRAALGAACAARRAGRRARRRALQSHRQ